MENMMLQFLFRNERYCLEGINDHTVLVWKMSIPARCVGTISWLHGKQIGIGFHCFRDTQLEQHCKAMLTLTLMESLVY